MNPAEQVFSEGDTHVFTLSIFEVTDKGLRAVPFHGVRIPFVRGSRSGCLPPSGDLPQRGIITEQLINVAIRHLRAVNVDDLKNEYTNRAIGHLEEAIRELAARQEDRHQRGVQQTYQK